LGCHVYLLGFSNGVFTVVRHDAKEHMFVRKTMILKLVISWRGKRIRISLVYYPFNPSVYANILATPSR
jgi:hypothetical protein